MHISYKAIGSAIQTCYPEAKIIMCWFHMKANVKKHVPKEKKNEINLDVLDMHLSLNETQFDTKWKNYEKKWKKVNVLKEFTTYFKKQWVDNVQFANWQIYHTSPGLASTNNPLEQYNRVIKAHFTKYLALNINTAVETFSQIIDYESKQPFLNADFKTVSRSMIDKSKKLNAKKFIDLTNNEFSYKHRDGTECLINMNERKCSCHNFLDKGACLHLIRACHITETSIPGIEIPKQFFTKRRAKKKQIIDSDSDSDDNSNTKLVEVAVPSESIPAKRGPKPKQQAQALVNNIPIENEPITAKRGPKPKPKPKQQAKAIANNIPIETVVVKPKRKTRAKKN